MQTRTKGKRKRRMGPAFQWKRPDFELNDNYKNTFRVEDGILKASYDQYESFNGEFGHLITRKKFSFYKLRVEYRFVGEQVPGGPGWGIFNNGAMLHCQSAESMLLDQDFPVSIEAQLLGGYGDNYSNEWRINYKSLHRFQL